MKSVDLDSRAGFVAFVVLCVLLILGWVTVSYFEASSYNRVTGADVSTWDAMFVDLRIVSEPSK